MRNQLALVIGLLVAGCQFGRPQDPNAQPRFEDKDGDGHPDPKLLPTAKVIDVAPGMKLPTEAERDALRGSLCEGDRNKWEAQIYLQYNYSDQTTKFFKCDNSYSYTGKANGPRFEDQFRERFTGALQASCKKRSGVAVTDVSPQLDKYTGYCDGRLVIEREGGASSTENILGGSLHAGAVAVTANVGPYVVHLDVPDAVKVTAKGRVAVLEGPGFSMQIRRYGGEGGRALIPRGVVADKIVDESEYRVIYRSGGTLRFAEMFELNQGQELVVESTPGHAFTRSQIDAMSTAAQTMRVD